jgi:hypothetical protein
VSAAPAARVRRTWVMSENLRDRVVDAGIGSASVHWSMPAVSEAPGDQESGGWATRTGDKRGGFWPDG